MNSQSPPSKDAARKKAETHFQAWESRTALVKQELAAERAATDAKTARLRALRLAKEAADQESARLAAEIAPAPPRKRGKDSV
jgi:hypothetical protein